MKISQRSTHTLPPLNSVPLIPGPLYARCSTHIWTPILLMFHSYLDPILQNVPLIPVPYLAKCSSHFWTPWYKMFHSYLDHPYRPMNEALSWDYSCVLVRISVKPKLQFSRSFVSKCFFGIRTKQDKPRDQVSLTGVYGLNSYPPVLINVTKLYFSSESIQAHFSFFLSGANFFVK